MDAQVFPVLLPRVTNTLTSQNCNRQVGSGIEILSFKRGLGLGYGRLTACVDDLLLWVLSGEPASLSLKVEIYSCVVGAAYFDRGGGGNL